MSYNWKTCVLQSLSYQGFSTTSITMTKLSSQLVHIILRPSEPQHLWLLSVLFFFFETSLVDACVRYFLNKVLLIHHRLQHIRRRSHHHHRVLCRPKRISLSIHRLRMRRWRLRQYKEWPTNQTKRLENQNRRRRRLRRSRPNPPPPSIASPSMCVLWACFDQVL